METYVYYVKHYPIISAMIQFALLGTLGEMISRWIHAKKLYLPFKLTETLYKMVEWAILAIMIKYAFAGFKGFVAILEKGHYLPTLTPFTKALAISVSVNLQFGLLLVLVHRLLDNLYTRQQNWSGIDKGFYSLLWFWIPAHTITFMLPKHYQIGLAALWSVVLGVILGYIKKPETTK